MKQFIGSIVIMLTLMSCQNNNTKQPAENLGNTHKVTVLDVLQTNNYTYLYVKENGVDLWLAVPKTTAQRDDVLYYDGGMLMTNFHSKELNRDFDKVLFLDGIRKTLKPETADVSNMHGSKMSKNIIPKINKEEVNIKPVSGSISIEDLYKNKTKFANKTVTIKGKVTKFNEAIMNKNWVHIQDGTEFNGNFDLTVTTQAVVKVGDTVIFKGKIALDKDFGYGYSYKVLMEDGILQ